MVFVWISSRFANALVFLVLDVALAWCINRSLKFMQGFFIYWRARQGAKWKMACSRVPLIPSDVLRGNANFPSIFVLLNAIVLVLLFVGTLGVNGETRKRYSRVNLTHVTSVYGDVPILDMLPRRILSSCARQNATTIEYWPVAFNISYKYLTILERQNYTCQFGNEKHRPEDVQYLLRAECVSVRNKSCTFDDMSLDLDFDVAIDLPQNRTITSFSDTTMYSFRDTNSEYEQLRDRKGFVVIMDEYRHATNDAFFVFNDTTGDFFFLGLGAKPPHSRNLRDFFYLYSLARVSPKSLLGDQSPFLSAMRYSTKESMRCLSPTLTLVLRYWISRALGTTALKWNAYESKDEEGTEISLLAVIPFSILIAFSFVLLLFEHIVYHFLVRKKNIPLSELRTNDLNYFSRSMQGAFEGITDKKLTNEFVSITAQTDRFGAAKVGHSFRS